MIIIGLSVTLIAIKHSSQIFNARSRAFSSGTEAIDTTSFTHLSGRTSGWGRLDFKIMKLAKATFHRTLNINTFLTWTSSRASTPASPTASMETTPTWLARRGPTAWTCSQVRGTRCSVSTRKRSARSLPLAVSLARGAPLFHQKSLSTPCSSAHPSNSYLSSCVSSSREPRVRVVHLTLIAYSHGQEEHARGL